MQALLRWLRQLAYHTVCQSKSGKSRLRMRLQRGYTLNLKTHVDVNCFDKHANLLMIACVRACWQRQSCNTSILFFRVSVQLPAVSLFPHQ